MAPVSICECKSEDVGVCFIGSKCNGITTCTSVCSRCMYTLKETRALFRLETSFKTKPVMWFELPLYNEGDSACTSSAPSTLLISVTGCVKPKIEPCSTPFIQTHHDKHSCHLHSLKLQITGAVGKSWSWCCMQSFYSGGSRQHRSVHTLVVHSAWPHWTQLTVQFLYWGTM